MAEWGSGYVTDISYVHDFCGRWTADPLSQRENRAGRGMSRLRSKQSLAALS